MVEGCVRRSEEEMETVDGGGDTSGNTHRQLRQSVTADGHDLALRSHSFATRRGRSRRLLTA